MWTTFMCFEWYYRRTGELSVNRNKLIVNNTKSLRRAAAQLKTLFNHMESNHGEKDPVIEIFEANFGFKGLLIA